jgi:hypothetical protein
LSRAGLGRVTWRRPHANGIVTASVVTYNTASEPVKSGHRNSRFIVTAMTTTCSKKIS